MFEPGQIVDFTVIILRYKNFFFKYKVEYLSNLDLKYINTAFKTIKDIVSTKPNKNPIKYRQ